ncbi:MAG TPA: hypothetical protein VL354_00165 [Spirochaetia bacterium]|nr:hypothetical protein [Spirochaetia bacterium]
MQLWGKRQEENPAEFWRKTGEKRGGEIGLFSFATFLGRSGDGPAGLPGLLYTVGDRVWFEDFERDNWLSKILGSRQKYEKTELCFDRSEVVFSRVVSRAGAYRCVGGGIGPELLRPMSGFGRLFAAHALQVGLQDSSSVFMEIMREEEFRTFLGK